MPWGVIGIHTRLHNLPIQEQLAKAAKRCFSTAYPDVVVLQTCNRTEIYFSASDLAERHSSLLSSLREYMQDPFESMIYSLFHEDCFFHLSQVCCGMDSLIVGESDIQRQVKISYQEACLQNRLPSSLHYLFQKALKLSKYIRSQVGFPKSHLNLEKIVYHKLLLEQKKMQKALKVLFVGNSEMNRKIRSLIPGFETSLLTRCGNEVKETWQNSKILSWEEKDSWCEYDVVIAASQAPHFVISFSSKLQFFKKIVLIDLSMPRIIDPELAGYPFLEIWNMDDLSKILERQKQNLHKQQESLNEILRDQVSRQIELYERKCIKKEFICTA